MDAKTFVLKDTKGNAHSFAFSAARAALHSDTNFNGRLDSQDGLRILAIHCPGFRVVPHIRVGHARLAPLSAPVPQFRYSVLPWLCHSFSALRLKNLFRKA